ncbi:lanthionine synthetase C family protein [Nonomuraea sp. CA-143628]|uniref:lanthionine synthetase C family protein n=1 Tax=Nonomuraea sp. CA-143628 TaxID=3239997 RepID=UPI003D908F9C
MVLRKFWFEKGGIVKPNDSVQRRQAVNLARETMAALRDRRRLADQHWVAHSMARGDIGLAMTCGAFAELWPEESWDVSGHAFLQAALQARFAPRSTSLFNSVTGIAFALRCLSLGGVRYQNAIRQVEAELFYRVDTALDELPAEGGLAEADYDLINGLCGVAAHLTMAAQHSAKAATLLERVMQRLTDWGCQPSPGGLWTPAHRVLDRDRDLHPELRGGYLNLGVAHGIAGPLSLACLVQLAGRVGLDLRPLITSLAERLCASVVLSEGGADIPYHVLPPGVHHPERQTRTAWCYGNPGAARALQLAAHACGRPDWENTAVAILHAALGRDAESRGIPSPNFCHGRAGLVHLLHRFTRDTSRPDPTLIGHLDRELDKLLDMYDPASPYGFREVDLHGRAQDNPGFLEGAAGVAAVLAAFGSDKPMMWERAVVTA